jgi:radical SAM protein with 4Fe4S-binding SPASM domain
MNKNFKTPLFVSIDLSNRCNLNCIHCRNNKTKITELNYNKIIELINELENLEIFHLSFSGGEPFLHPEIYEILEYAQKLNFPKITITTNCVFIDRSKISKLDRTKIRFAISLDGPKDIHNLIRGKDVFDNVKENISYLVADKFYIMLNCTLMKQNYKYFDDIIKIGKELKVNQINFSKVFPVHPEIKQFMLTKEDLNELYDKYKHYSDEKDIVLFFDKGYIGFPDDCDKDISIYMGCRAGISQVNIMSDGSVIGCKLLPQICAGSIYKNDIKTIWENNDNWKIFRNMKDTVNNKICNDCKYFEACKGGCRAVAYYVTGNISSRDPFCPL